MKQYTSTDEYFNDLKGDIKKYASNVAKYAAIEIREDLANTAYQAIDDFYAEYPEPGVEPYVYDRYYHNFLKENGRSKVVKKFYHDRNGYYFTAGIILTSEFMDDVYYYIRHSDHQRRGATVDQVYYSVIEQGLHGLPIVGTPQMAISPLEILQERKKYIEKHIRDYKNKGAEIASKEKYNVLFQD